MKRRSFLNALTVAGASLSALISGTSSASSAGYKKTTSAGKIDARLKELGITLPPATAPVAVYAAYRKVGNMVYIAGQGPDSKDHTKYIGTVGKDLTTEQAYDAARFTGIKILAQLKAACEGDLDRVVQAVQLLGTVNCVDRYMKTPNVINGCSELLRDVFGEAGLAARAAMGANALPGNISCEIISIFEIRP